MIKFNSTDIVVGYIKQLLKDFNLPNAKPADDTTHLYDKCLYIKNNNIIQYNKEKENFIARYIFGKRYENYTRNLHDIGLSYDTETHEYLGNYLRFIRDFKHVNLMPLYNCFSNRYLSSKLDITLQERRITQDSGKILIIPVKFFNKYTIAIDSQTGFDCWCGFYDKNYFCLDDLDNQTFKHYSSSNFDNPIVYSELIEENLLNLSLTKHIYLEDNLKLFIRLPKTNKSTIIVMEGDYSRDIDFALDGTEINKPIVARTVISHEKNWIDRYGNVRHDKVSDLELSKVHYSTFNSLLYLNTGEQYAFADRLIEYLVGNVICSMETIDKNIIKTELQLSQTYKDYGVGIRTAPLNYGFWNEKYRDALYNLAAKRGTLGKSFDILGYVDKDIESILGEEPNLYKED